jgi:hypothetical protein
MMASLRTKHKLNALVIQGKALMNRGNVSMEEVDAYIGLSDAVLAGEVPATLSANTAISSSDPDVKLEMAVTEVAAMNDGDIGQVPPVDSVISMDDAELGEYDTLIDESEEFSALSHFGTVLGETELADSAKSFEQYKLVVVNACRRNGVSLEDIAQIEAAVDIDGIVAKVDDVRDVADEVIEVFCNNSDSGNVVTVESAQGTAGTLNHVVERARRHIAKKGKV